MRAWRGIFLAQLSSFPGSAETHWKSRGRQLQAQLAWKPTTLLSLATMEARSLYARHRRYMSTQLATYEYVEEIQDFNSNLTNLVILWESIPVGLISLLLPHEFLLRSSWSMDFITFIHRSPKFFWQLSCISIITVRPDYHLLPHRNFGLTMSRRLEYEVSTPYSVS